MTKSKRTQALVAVFGITVIGAIVFFATQLGDKRPAPSSSGYYAGPMRAKGTTHYGDDSGKEVPPPSGGAVQSQDGPKASNQVE